MAWPRDMINWEIWSRTKAIWLMSVLNLLLNAMSVHLLWLIYGALSHAGAPAAAAAASSATQQIAVVNPAPATGG